MVLNFTVVLGNARTALEWLCAYSKFFEFKVLEEHALPTHISLQADFQHSGQFCSSQIGSASLRKERNR